MCTLSYRLTRASHGDIRTGKRKLVVDATAGDSVPTVVVDPLEIVVLVRRRKQKDVQGLLKRRVQREIYGVHRSRRPGHRPEGARLTGHHQQLAQECQGGVAVQTYAVLFKNAAQNLNAGHCCHDKLWKLLHRSCGKTERRRPMGGFVREAAIRMSQKCLVSFRKRKAKDTKVRLPTHAAGAPAKRWTFYPCCCCCRLLQANAAAFAEHVIIDSDNK